MSISKVGLYGLSKKADTRGRSKSKWTTTFIALITTVFLLSSLDLLLAFIREDSLFSYTRSIIVDLVLSTLGLILCSDLIVDEDQDSVTCFLAYMVFLWVCITVLKLVFLI